MVKNSIKLVVVMALFVLALLTSCQSGTKEPAIKITSNTKALHPIYGTAENTRDFSREMNRLRIGGGKRHTNYPTYAQSKSWKDKHI